MATKIKKSAKKKAEAATLISSMRELTDNRSIRLYKDQVQSVAEIESKLDRSLNLTEMIRDGLDLVIAKMKEHIED